jgi:hypothetical protein
MHAGLAEDSPLPRIKTRSATGNQGEAGGTGTSSSQPATGGGGPHAGDLDLDLGADMADLDGLEVGRTLAG